MLNENLKVDYDYVNLLHIPLPKSKSISINHILYLLDMIIDHLVLLD